MAPEDDVRVEAILLRVEALQDRSLDIESRLFAIGDRLASIREKLVESERRRWEANAICRTVRRVRQAGSVEETWARE